VNFYVRVDIKFVIRSSQHLVLCFCSVSPPGSDSLQSRFKFYCRCFLF